MNFLKMHRHHWVNITLESSHFPAQNTWRDELCVISDIHTLLSTSVEMIIPDSATGGSWHFVFSSCWQAREVFRESPEQDLHLNC